MSETSELAQAVKAAASLQGCEYGRYGAMGKTRVHQSDGDFQDVVAESKVGEAVEPGRGLCPDALLGISEVLLRVLV
jgi:hypothetical protein